MKNRIRPTILVLGLLFGAFATIGTTHAKSLQDGVIGDILWPLEGPPDGLPDSPPPPPPPPPIKERHVSTSYTVDPTTGLVIGIVYNCAPGGDNCPVGPP